jgi:hypothetical protein
MFDTVTPNQHQLALPIQPEGIHQAEPGLSRSSATR